MQPNSGTSPAIAAATGVCEKTTPFVRALTMQSSSQNFFPPPELWCFENWYSHVFFSGGVFFQTTQVSSLPLPLGGGRKRRHSWAVTFIPILLPEQVLQTSSCTILSIINISSTNCLEHGHGDSWLTAQGVNHNSNITIITTHKLLNPPLLNPPLWTPDDSLLPWMHPEWHWFGCTTCLTLLV